LAIAALLFGFGMLAVALAAGGSLPMIALGLIFAALSMNLFYLANAEMQSRAIGADTVEDMS
jgi:hypothetical protein